jgi:hypothetical protein
MLRLNSKLLSTATQAHLDAVQEYINALLHFIEKSNAAGTKWDSKDSSNAGKKAFAEIKLILTSMCVGKGICNYCEANEATDIEHIRAKSLFPEYAFFWENYILACKICNTTYKMDKASIFAAKDSCIIVDISPKRGATTKTKPPNDDTLLINPRTENPTRFIMLDLVGGTFNYIPKKPVGTREYLRADYSINTLLKLNDRQALVEARKAAFKDFQNLLKNYIDCGKATTHDELELATGDYPQVNHANPLSSEIIRIQTHIKNSITSRAQPTVWLEMKRQRAKLNFTNQLFKQAPEVLSW